MKLYLLCLFITCAFRLVLAFSSNLESKPNINVRIFKAGGTKHTNVQEYDIATPSPALKVGNQQPAYQNLVDLGEKKTTFSARKVFTLAVLSGLQIGAGSLLSFVVGGDIPGIKSSNPGLQKIISGIFGIPFGLFMIVVGGGELFTGNTAFLTAALLEGKAEILQVAHNWTLSYIGNFVGSLLMAWLATSSGMLSNSSYAAGVAVAKVGLSFKNAFLRGVFCNWLVCTAVMMAVSSSNSIGKFVSCLIPISMFVACGGEHSIANMCMIPLGMNFAQRQVKVLDFLLKNLLPVTLGNIFGGAICVAFLYHIAYGKYSSQ